MKCFVVTPPGFESETAAEIREIWSLLLDPSARPHSLPMPEINEVLGGLELELEAFTAVQLNFFLKTASRVLLRLEEFRVRDFPKLHERLKKIDLRSWIGTGDAKLEVAAQGSRLGHEGRIRETAAKAWALDSETKSERRIFIRIVDDQCVVSLDTSGEHLHRRGVNTLRGAAPMRETLAAFCLRKMMADVPAGELKKITLVDPMCGSGTLLTEAASLWNGNFHRSYAFQTFGKQRLPQLFSQPQFEKNYRALPAELSPFAAYRGFDLDPKMVEISTKNASVLSNSAGSFRFHQGDVFSPNPPVGELSEKTWVICNPPYGERLAGKPVGELVEALLRQWNPERWALLLPEKDVRAARALPVGWKAEIPVKNGGLPCQLLIGLRGEKP